LCDSKPFVFTHCAKKLSGRSALRYRHKIKSIVNIDPYMLGEHDDNISENPESFPKIQFGDIYIYLILRKSAYSNERFHAYKSLEA
jgi:hypothetical protein